MAAAPSSSSRVDIAPQRRRDPPPANREPCDACRPPPSTLIGTDLLDITGGEPTEPATTPDGPRDTATVRSDAAERQKVIKGRVRVTERSSRRLVASFCFRRVAPSVRPTGLRQHHHCIGHPHSNCTTLRKIPYHKSTQASLGLLWPLCLTCHSETVSTV